MRHKEPTGQRIETKKAFILRHYVITAEGRKKVCTKLADKSERYCCWADVEPLIARVLATSNDTAAPSGATLLSDFVEKEYLPYCKRTKAPSTLHGYNQVWRAHWQKHLGHLALTAVSTAQVTSVLDELAKAGKGRYTLGHTKWFLSGVYEYAKAKGIVPQNPVIDAKWTERTERPKKQREYTLAEVLRMLAILEPLDIRAAVALAIAFFTGLRPSEIRGLRWEDFTGDELHVRRSVWRNHTSETKTEDSAGSVPVIEPLRGLLEKLRAAQKDFATADAPILQNQNRKPLSLDSIAGRIIAPAMEKARIDWRGYYPGRRGISSLVTDTSKNALNSTGLLRHSTPITALRHYTRAQKDSIRAALEMVERMATSTETVQ